MSGRYAATGYGYIQAGDRITRSVRAVSRFVEKPRRSTAVRYLRTGGYLWNSGMFLLFAASRIRDGRVFAFELIPDTFEVLARNCGEISRLQPRAFNIGLADRTGSAEFTYFYRSSVVSSMQPDDSPEFRAFGRTMVADHILEMRVSRSGAPAVRPRRVSVDRHRHPRQTLIPLFEPIP